LVSFSFYHFQHFVVDYSASQSSSRVIDSCPSSTLLVAIADDELILEKLIFTLTEYSIDVIIKTQVLGSLSTSLFLSTSVHLSFCLSSLFLSKKFPFPPSLPPDAAYQRSSLHPVFVIVSPDFT
jgi:hypothetical protein